MPMSSESGLLAKQKLHTQVFVFLFLEQYALMEALHLAQKAGEARICCGSEMKGE
jgi:hypothetical protein